MKTIFEFLSTDGKDIEFHSKGFYTTGTFNGEYNCIDPDLKYAYIRPSGYIEVFTEDGLRSILEKLHEQIKTMTEDDDAWTEVMEDIETYEELMKLPKKQQLTRLKSPEKYRPFDGPEDVQFPLGVRYK